VRSMVRRGEEISEMTPDPPDSLLHRPDLTEPRCEGVIFFFLHVWELRRFGLFLTQVEQEKISCEDKVEVPGLE